MRIDPKYFNLFIAVCAVLTLIVIIYGTINYSRNQVADFKENLETIQFDTLSFSTYSGSDSLHVSHYKGNPVIIQFWSTWSGKSLGVNRNLEMIRKNNPRLTVIAAAVRDGDEQIREYIRESDYNFHYVDGTAFFQEIFIPGVPAQILIDENGELFSSHVGDDMEALSGELNNLLQNE
ncbi:MAG: TlpA disulfide reductase family protein [Balneolaceae bacterium]